MFANVAVAMYQATNPVIKISHPATAAGHLPKANTIGALMLHLAATETYYQLNTFEGKKWDTWPDSVKQKWDAATIIPIITSGLPVNREQSRSLPTRGLLDNFTSRWPRTTNPVSAFG